MKTEPTPAERAAEEIATALLTPHGGQECDRLQIMLRMGQDPCDERNMGGWCKSAIVKTAAAIIDAHVPTDDSRRLDQLQVAFGQSDDEMDLLGVLLKIRQGMTLRQAVDACLGGLTVGPDAHVPAEARDMLDEALRAGLQAAKACPLNTTYHERVMNEARAFLASSEAHGWRPIESGMVYARRDIEDLCEYYTRHLDAMTRENLHSKSDIAAELAWRDREIDRLRDAYRNMREFAESKGLDTAAIAGDGEGGVNPALNRDPSNPNRLAR